MIKTRSTSGTTYTAWVEEFEAERERRAALGDPDWARGARLPVEIVRSVQKFQVGEDGDGAALTGKADRAGDDPYAAAVRLFIAEEQNHARMLALLLAAGGAGTLDGHWSDAAFVRLRRLMGLKLELLVLMVAEVVSLRYYRALRDGSPDPLASEVARRLLADEERHVPFHCRRLNEGLAPLPRPARRAVTAGWRVLLAGAAVVVAVDHGPALRALGVGRRAFVADVLRSSAVMASAMVDGPVAEPVAGHLAV
ncbi:ferritin-like domain-containing protein [Streptomyces sp. NPDC054904]|uniref:ferritin-like domain-containing protein n=1 Tax=unclassified Streptomyces TaxID=2593676 RepID=UPI0024820BE1|nr:MULTISPECIES: ferritin-like domain-containing protein [unclassified Streptomyces]MDA5281508.1 ferritin-like domain-containing protein [Streptomyces sp. Isolate_45]MDX2394746.1 ferritin-like domain-containing protein [Streptomyces sp. DK15]